MEGRINFYYDKDGDILDISVGKPRKAISKEAGDDILIRVIPGTNKIIGLTILNFEKRFSKRDNVQTLPINGRLIVA
jgi:uncharacterized protein YuzE